MTGHIKLNGGWHASEYRKKERPHINLIHRRRQGRGGQVRHLHPTGFLEKLIRIEKNKSYTKY
jgi:hypothetical protein